MADFNNAVMTNGGAALLTATTAGKAKIKFTKLVIGSGTYTEQEKTRESLQTRTGLKIQEQEIPFSSITMVSETCVKLAALVSNVTLESGYYVNEVGIYALDEMDEEAEPVLYSIAVANVADYLPPYNGLAPSTITQEYFATVDNSLQTTIQIESGIVALAEDLIAETNRAGEKEKELQQSIDEIKSNAQQLGICKTPQGTTVKTVECPDFELRDGARVMVTFHNGNTCNYIKLNVNGTGEYFAYFPIDGFRAYNHELISKLIVAGCAYEFIYQDAETETNKKWVYCGVVGTPESIGALSVNGGTVTGNIEGSDGGQFATDGNVYLNSQGYHGWITNFLAQYSQSRGVFEGNIDDLRTSYNNGAYWITQNAGGTKPFDYYFNLLVFNVGDSNTVQIAVSHNGNGVAVYTYVRNYINNVWSAWRRTCDDGNAATASKAATLANGGNIEYTAMTFSWNGQAGQPSWVWGGNDGISMYVYNPSNFNVNSAVKDGDGKVIADTYVRRCVTKLDYLGSGWRRIAQLEFNNATNARGSFAGGCQLTIKKSYTTSAPEYYHVELASVYDKSKFKEITSIIGSTQYIQKLRHVRVGSTQYIDMYYTASKYNTITLILNNGEESGDYGKPWTLIDGAVVEVDAYDTLFSSIDLTGNA